MSPSRGASVPGPSLIRADKSILLNRTMEPQQWKGREPPRPAGGIGSVPLFHAASSKSSKQQRNHHLSVLPCHATLDAATPKPQRPLDCRVAISVVVVYLRSVI